MGKFNTLHIITPAYRFENLELIYNSILMNDDIIWHISKSNKREDINFDFIKKDDRVKIYNVDCEDNEIYKKPLYDGIPFSVNEDKAIEILRKN